MYDVCLYRVCMCVCCLHVLILLCMFRVRNVHVEHIIVLIDNVPCMCSMLFEYVLCVVV